MRRAAALAAGTFLYTWRVEPHWVEVVRRSLPIANLPPALSGARVVQISDVHAGPIVDQRFLLEEARKVADLYPDLILLTGDYMTYDRRTSVRKAAEFVAALPKPRLGCLAVLGNHDYGFNARLLPVGDEMSARLSELGVRVLRNEATIVEGLQFAGIDDLYTPNFRPEQAMAALDRSMPAVTMVHNPDAVDQLGWGDFRGWILCGHTHGGQCKPPFLPPPLLPVTNRNYVAGEYELGDGRRMYVNRGLGYLHRVRFNCRPEITVFTLEQALDDQA